MNFVIVGTNHKYSPISLREKISFTRSGIPQALREILRNKEISSGVVLSTCNRVEVYATADDTERGIAILCNFLAGPRLYAYIGKEAIGHLFSVASGLDSQIIGEPQILGQINYAYQQAKGVGATNSLLEKVFGQAIAVSRKVRKSTDIDKGDISLASIVVELIRQETGALKDKKILLIGVGKISELLVDYLKKEELQAVFIANRTLQKAEFLAKKIGAEVVGFDRLKEKLKEADVVISATASPHVILRKEVLLQVTDNRKLLIDLAVPRDIELDVRDIKGISLFTLEDLGPLIKDNLEERILAVPKAAEIVKNEAERLWQLIESLELEPAEALLP